MTKGALPPARPGTVPPAHVWSSVQLSNHLLSSSVPGVHPCGTGPSVEQDLLPVQGAPSHRGRQHPAPADPLGAAGRVGRVAPPWLFRGQGAGRPGDVWRSVGRQQQARVCCPTGRQRSGLMISYPQRCRRSTEGSLVLGSQPSWACVAPTRSLLCDLAQSGDLL